LAKGVNRRLGALHLIGRSLHGELRRDLASEFTCIYEEASELLENLRHHVGPDRHRHLRPSGEGDVAQKGQSLGKHLRFGREMRSQRKEQ
jgi:hypothetical protein